jgi:hypothetical protein
MILAAAAAVCPGLCRAQQQERSQDACRITIDLPRPGTQVGTSTPVNGAAVIKTGTHLWVFAHRKGLAIWWPQGSGEASIRDGQWEVLANIGGPDDRGAQFEIMAAVVDSNEDSKLNKWVQDSEQSGKYPGIKLPPSVAECGAPRIVTVTRIN